MKLTDWLAAMERIAPKALALDWDNVGLLIGTERTEVRRVLVALDLTGAVADEAAAFGADLVLTHHPSFFHAVRGMDPFRADTAAAYRLIQSGIGHFAAHTNLDAAEGGVNDALCALLGVKNTIVLPPENIVRHGTLNAPCSLAAFAKRTRAALGGAVLYSGDPAAQALRVAVVGGEGSDMVALAAEHGADTLVTGECRHHAALAARELGLNVIVAGHYETERIVLPILIDRLQRETNDVLYQIALAETSPFRSAEEGMT